MDQSFLSGEEGKLLCNGICCVAKSSKVRNLVHKCPPQHPVLSQINPSSSSEFRQDQFHWRPPIFDLVFEENSFCQVFWSVFLYEFCISARRATCLIPSPLTWTNNPVIGLYREKFSYRSPSCLNFLNLPLLSLLHPDFVLRSAFCVLVIWETSFHTHVQNRQIQHENVIGSSSDHDHDQYIHNHHCIYDGTLPVWSFNCAVKFLLCLWGHEHSASTISIT